MSDANIYLTPEVFRLVSDDATRQGGPASELITQIVERHYYSSQGRDDGASPGSVAGDLLAHHKALQVENASLRDDLTTATAEIQRLRDVEVTSRDEMIDSRQRTIERLEAEIDALHSGGAYQAGYDAGKADGYTDVPAGDAITWRDYWRARAETWQAEALRRGDIIERARDALSEVGYS